MILAFARHLQQRVLEAVAPIGQIYALLDEPGNDRGMAFPHGEVNGWCVVVFAANQTGLARRQVLHRLQVAFTAGRQHGPDIRRRRLDAAQKIVDKTSLPKLRPGCGGPQAFVYRGPWPNSM